MKKIQKFFAVLLISLLQLAIGQLSANAQSTTSSYSVVVNTPGTFGQVMLQTVENWSDVVELTITGHLNSSDMEYFSRLQNMTKLDLSQVEISSFKGCAGLKLLQNVVLPQSVSVIEDNAFSGCSSLSTINLDQIEEIGSNAFSNCKSLAGTITLTNLKNLGSAAFYYCDSISSIEMPILTKIGSGAFNGASSLTSVIVPNVKSLGSRAFQNCSKLESIDLPNCLYFGNDNLEGSDYDWAGECFDNCRSLSRVTLSEDLEFIPYRTFSSTALKSIKFPSKLKVIGREAFNNLPLSTIEIPEGVQIIRESAFGDCPLESITLSSTLECIDYGAFYYCKESYDSSAGDYVSSYVLKEVYSKSIVPIKTSVFNNDMVKDATLYVPAFSVSAYKLDDNWYKFNKIEAIEGDLSDVTINTTFNIIDYTGLADNANLALTSSNTGATAGHLTISGKESLSLNNFLQTQNFKFERAGYYDDNGNYMYRYTYPYCTTLITNSEIRANNVTTKIQLPTNRWSFISMPYDVNVSDIVVPKGTMWVVRKYNGTNRASMSGDTWENVTSEQILNAGEGYIFHCVNDDADYVEFEFPAINNSTKNNLFRYDDVVSTIKEYPSEFSHNRGWNLIGNPYPAYLSSHYVDFPAPITVWNGDGYTAYSLADDDYVLRPNEAFFVQCPVNTNQMKFFKDGRRHDAAPSSASYRSRAKVQSSEIRTILNFILADENYSDRVRLVLNEAAAYDYEIERDASKFMSNNETVPQIYIIDNGVNFAIDERPLGSGEFSLGMRIGKEGKYTISLNSKNSDYDILLIDKETNEITNLTTNAYLFESTAQTENDRFSIKVAAKSGQSSIENITANSVEFFVNGNTLTIDRNTAITVYSIDGNLVYKGMVDGSIELQSGIYLLYINNTTHKIVIK